MLSARVSNLESYRQWKEEEDLGLGWLIERIFESKPSPAMLAGTAFHKALELADYTSFETMSANGYTFHIECDCELEVPKIREIRGFKKYGDLDVSGQCDAINGRIVTDYKTTGYFDADRYMSGYQWRYYLDIFEADVFRWQIFEIKPVVDAKIPREFDQFEDHQDSKEYVVRSHHQLEQKRYPDMHADCMKLAKEYAEFYRAYLANYRPITLEDQLRASIEQVRG